MKTQVNKLDLIKTIEGNRAKHRETFLKALEKFKERALQEFERGVQKLKEARVDDVRVYLTAPKDQTKDYDRVLGLLARSTENTVTLDENDYAKYVLDQWEWTHQWKTTNSTYGIVDPDDE